MLTEPRPPLANRRTYFVQRRRDRLSHVEEMLLLYGPADEWRDAFASVEAARAAWERNRERLMSRYGPGRRPWAWHEFEAPPGLTYDRDRERSTLFTAGLITDEAERAELLALWRREFARAGAPDFFHCEGPGRVLRGEAARRAHYRWADIPPALIEEWSERADAGGSARSQP